MIPMFEQKNNYQIDNLVKKMSLDNLFDEINMNKFRFTSIAMLIFMIIFSGIIIAQNNNAAIETKVETEQTTSGVDPGGQIP